MFSLSFLGWGGTSHFVHRPLFGLQYRARMADDECGTVGEVRISTVKRNTKRKPSLSTTDPTSRKLGQKPRPLRWKAAE
jgi:hypothetical protein